MLSLILFIASLVLFGVSLYLYDGYNRKKLIPFAEVITEISSSTKEQEKKLTTFFEQYDSFIEGYNKNNQMLMEEMKRITYIEKEKNEIDEKEEEEIMVDENFRVPIVPGLKFKFEGDDTLYKPQIITNAKPKRKAK
jgi:hypothetical protein